jgi:hypothetical protein
MVRLISICFGIAHLTLVLFIAYAIATSTDPVAVNLWLLFITVDFPVSLGMFPLAHLIDGNAIMSRLDENGEYNIFRDIDNYWFPFIYSGLFGTIWWYFLPTLFVKVKNVFKSKVVR